MGFLSFGGREKLWALGGIGGGGPGGGQRGALLSSMMGTVASQVWPGGVGELSSVSESVSSPARCRPRELLTRMASEKL